MNAKAGRKFCMKIKMKSCLSIICLFIVEINPFSLVMDNSKFIAMARVFNTKVIIISYDWAVAFFPAYYIFWVGLEFLQKKPQM